jgi:regulator of replication initiation timing
MFNLFKKSKEKKVDTQENINESVDDMSFHCNEMKKNIESMQANVQEFIRINEENRIAMKEMNKIRDRLGAEINEHLSSLKAN